MAKQTRTKVESRVTIHRSREGTHEAVVNRVVETTECDRLATVSGDSQTIGEFLDWLQHERAKAVTLCILSDYDRFVPLRVRIEQLLAEYFEIDLDKVERERRGVLAALQEAQR